MCSYLLGIMCVNNLKCVYHSLQTSLGRDPAGNMHDNNGGDAHEHVGDSGTGGIRNTCAAVKQSGRVLHAPSEKAMYSSSCLEGCKTAWT